MEVNLKRKSKTNSQPIVKKPKTKQKSYNMILNDFYQTLVDRPLTKLSKGHVNSLYSKKEPTLTAKNIKERQSLKTIKKHVLSVLYTKYNSKKETYNRRVLRNILTNKSCKLVLLYKEIKFNNENEYLRRAYTRHECRDKLPSIANYYKNYLKFFCKPTFKNFRINSIIQNYGDSKAELYYKRNYINGATKENKYVHIQQDLKTIFNDSVKRNIDKHFISLSNINNSINSIDDDFQNKIISIKKPSNKKYKTSSDINNFKKEESLKMSFNNLDDQKSNVNSTNEWQNSIALILTSLNKNNQNENPIRIYKPNTLFNTQNRGKIKNEYYLKSVPNIDHRKSEKEANSKKDTILFKDSPKFEKEITLNKIANRNSKAINNKSNSPRKVQAMETKSKVTNKYPKNKKNSFGIKNELNNQPDNININIALNLQGLENNLETTEALSQAKLSRNSNN